jgi:hypothetical protein
MLGSLLISFNTVSVDSQKKAEDKYGNTLTSKFSKFVTKLLFRSWREERLEMALIQISVQSHKRFLNIRCTCF